MIIFDEETDLEQLKTDAQRGSVEAQFQVGMRYARGRSVGLDYQEAFTWFEKAAKKNHAYAQYRLGMAYLLGLGVDKDLVEAAIWFAFSAAQGVEPAIAALEIVRMDRRRET